MKLSRENIVFIALALAGSAFFVVGLIGRAGYDISFIPFADKFFPSTAYVDPCEQHPCYGSDNLKRDFPPGHDPNDLPESMKDLMKQYSSASEGSMQAKGEGEYTVRKIVSHYPHTDTNSETTLIVYENGSTGHTKEILCLFPPDFQLDDNLSTPKLEEMAIPLNARKVIALRKSGKSDDAIFQMMYEQDAKFQAGVDRVRAANPNMTEFEKLKFPEAMLNIYAGLDNYGNLKEDAKVPTPSLTGIETVRVLRQEQEYAFGETGYLCKKVR